MNEKEENGKELFFSDELACSSCHGTFLFTNQTIENNGLYEVYEDSGKYRLTNLHEDIGKFKVPSLRNIEITAPYMHNGSISSLEEVIEHYASGGKNHFNKSELITGFSITDEEKEKVIQLGGLYVIGTERHESRRIDNQLRGRSGRQGDPGESRFYISLEDELMRRFQGERIQSIMDKLNLPDDEKIEQSMVTKSIERAQAQVESLNFEIRKNVLKFDQVLNQQRDVIYKWRRELLTSDNIENLIIDWRDDIFDDLQNNIDNYKTCLLYTSPSPRD